MQEVRETKTADRSIVWLLILVNLTVPIFTLLQRSRNNLSDNANIWVGWISATLLTAMLVFGPHLRLSVDRRQISRKVMLASIALVVMSGLITTIFIAATPSDNYLVVALSDTPLNKITPDRKRLVVELIRRNKAASDENSRMARSMKPISPLLYSGGSFANKVAMESTSSQLKQAYDLDQAYVAVMHQNRQDFHNRMQRVDDNFLRDFESKMQANDILEASIEAEETKWVASVMSLYDFTSAHANDITVDTSGHLVIENDELKQKVLQQIDSSKALQQTMLNNRARAVKNQHTLQDALGMKHSD